MITCHICLVAAFHSLRRMNLGDPGPPSMPFLNLTQLLTDMLSSSYTNMLRWVPAGKVPSLASAGEQQALLLPCCRLMHTAWPVAGA